MYFTPLLMSSEKYNYSHFALFVEKKIEYKGFGKRNS